jgi:hypothetical protein
MGRIRFKLRQLPEAAEALEKARLGAEHLLAAVPGDPAHAHRLAKSAHGWAVAQAIQGRVDKAKPAFKQGLRVLRPAAVHNPEFRRTLARR